MSDDSERHWVVVERAPCDGAELVLFRRTLRDGERFRITAKGRELMSSQVTGSERDLGAMAAVCARDARAPLLVGGLGMGFTLRAALDSIGPAGEVVVSERFECVVRWCRGPLAALTGRALDDARVRVVVDDVGRVVRDAAPGSFGAIALDVDNGPTALVDPSNAGLYDAAGLRASMRALARGGALFVWSAGADGRFEARVRRAGLALERRKTSRGHDVVYEVRQL